MGKASDHALLSPSGKHRWGPCAGSLAMEDGIPNEDSEWSAEGTAAHILAARALTHSKPCEFFRGVELQADVGTPIFEVGDEFIDFVQVYVDEVQSRAAGNELHIEQRLDLSEVFAQPDQFGTGDAIVIDYGKRHLTVIDLKYGQGVKVFAEMNEQLLAYAAGAMSTFLLDGAIDYVTVVISQPRLYHLDEWTVSVESLAGWAYSAKMEAAKAVDLLARKRAGTLTQEQLETNLTPGEKQCQWCKAKAVCNKLSRHISAEVMDAFAAIDDGTAVAMSPPTVPDDNEALGRKASSVGLIRDWCGAVEAELRRRVTAGVSIIGSDGLPFKTVQAKAGNREWVDPKAAEPVLVEVYGDKAFEPRKIISPAVADTTLNGRRRVKNPSWARVAELYRQKPGSVSVVPGSDPRPAYSGEAGFDEFKDELTQ